MKFDADVQRYELICKRHSQKSCCVRVGVIGAVVGLIGFWIWFALFHILSFETWQRAIMFLLVSHCYMGVCKLRMMTCARFITVVPIVHESHFRIGSVHLRYRSRLDNVVYFCACVCVNTA
jgi:hypothetical protein